MNALENLLIIAGISLDIFAAMECQGSLVAKIDKKQLVKLCALIAAWQMAALFVGSYLSGLLYRVLFGSIYLLHMFSSVSLESFVL